MALSKKPVNGMKDILPAEMEIRDYVTSVIKETYRSFGFTPIETPCMENIANLSNKQGGENEKLIFKVLKRGEKLNLVVTRGKGKIRLNLRAVKEKNSSSYKLGIWVKDSSAGIGTLTFYSPSYNIICGLGHGVCDDESEKLLKIKSGEIVEAEKRAEMPPKREVLSWK